MASVQILDIADTQILRLKNNALLWLEKYFKLRVSNIYARFFDRALQICLQLLLSWLAKVNLV